MAAMTYEQAVEQHRWEVPERYNIAHDVCDKHPRDKPAMIHEDPQGTVRRLDWGELQDMSDRFARILRERVVEVHVAVDSLSPVGRLEHHHHVDRALGQAMAVRAVGHDDLGPGVAQAVGDALVAVEHRHREQDGPRAVDAEEHRRGLRKRRQQRGHAVAPFDPVGLEHVREPAGEVLKLAPIHAALVAAVVPPHHRQLVAIMLVADVVGDVVALGHVPGVLGDHLVVGAERVPAVCHLSSSTDGP